MEKKQKDEGELANDRQEKPVEMHDEEEGQEMSSDEPFSGLTGQQVFCQQLEAFPYI